MVDYHYNLVHGSGRSVKAGWPKWQSVGETSLMFKRGPSQPLIFLIFMYKIGFYFTCYPSAKRIITPFKPISMLNRMYVAPFTGTFGYATYLGAWYKMLIIKKINHHYLLTIQLLLIIILKNNY